MSVYEKRFTVCLFIRIEFETFRNIYVDMFRLAEQWLEPKWTRIFIILFNLFSIRFLVKAYRKEKIDEMKDYRKIFHKTAFDIALILSENVAGDALLA